MAEIFHPGTNGMSRLENPFRSFFMAGFECTDQLNAFGNRVDFYEITGHLQLLEDDYRMLLPFDILTVREGIRWSKAEKRPGEYDWSAVKYMLQHGRNAGIQQVWDICHFGFPDDLTPLHPHFARRFANLCKAFVEVYREFDPYGTLIVTPINEVNFLSWLGGEARGTTPYCTCHGWEVKYSLMRAFIAGVAAMREIDPSVKILTAEPLVNMVPPLRASPQQIGDAAAAHECQFQMTDILCGFICPELGGSPEYLDIIGLNYYYNNQWINGTGEFLPWANIDPDPRWIPLRQQIMNVYKRYKRPIIISETSHTGEHRPNWIHFIAEECAAAIQAQIPLWGMCLYPVINRPDWDHLTPWYESGVWGVVSQNGKLPQRVLHQPSAIALRKAKNMVMHTVNTNQKMVIAEWQK